ncbi:hypothetical protein B0H14DRAFT_2576516 [Mycena olivaceomarginata]|nr:hypothetical protein B0H14DRAFT_2576516 [Mycena olivaceomarginata]
MRMTLWYLKLCSAVAEGDIGRVFEVIKALFNSKSHDFEIKHLSEPVGLNISEIISLREHFPGLFGLKMNGRKHREAHSGFRVWTESGISGGQRIQPGNVSLEEGHPQNLSRPELAGEASPDYSEVEVDVLSCPITTVEGVMGVDNFITGLPTA